MFAVPTTLSAAEFTAPAGITNPDTGRKMMYRHRNAAPQVVVLDPAATLNTPMRLLLTSGIRAIDHAAEAFCSPAANPMTEAYALSAARLLSEALPAMKAAPENLVHRGNWRSSECGMAFSRPQRAREPGRAMPSATRWAPLMACHMGRRAASR
jgi:maleylacetate reductase